MKKTICHSGRQIKQAQSSTYTGTGNVPQTGAIEEIDDTWANEDAKDDDVEESGKDNSVINKMEALLIKVEKRGNLFLAELINKYIRQIEE